MEKANHGIKTRQQVAEEYGICVKTLIRQLEFARVILPPGVIFPKTLNLIYDTLGHPKKL